MQERREDFPKWKKSSMLEAHALRELGQVFMVEKGRTLSPCFECSSFGILALCLGTSKQGRAKGPTLLVNVRACPEMLDELQCQEGKLEAYRFIVPSNYTGKALTSHYGS